jgi:hypothetical protein
MNEALAIRARDKIAKATGLTSLKANIILREQHSGPEIVVMCADDKIRADCAKILPKSMDGLPVKIELRPTPGSTKGLRINTAHGRIVQRDK